MSILNKLTKILFGNRCKMTKIATFQKTNWNMCKTPSKMHLHDMVTIDTIVFEIVVGEGWLTPPLILKYLGKNRVQVGTCRGTRQFHNTVIN